MPALARIKVTGYQEAVEALDHLDDHFHSIPELAAEYAAEALAAIVKGDIRRADLIWSGAMLSAVQGVVLGLDRSGRVESATAGVSIGLRIKTLIYGATMNTGRKAGKAWAPLGLLRRWVRNRVRPPADELDEVTYLIGRKIAFAGIKGRGFLKRARRMAPMVLSAALEQEIDDALDEFNR